MMRHYIPRHRRARFTPEQWVGIQAFGACVVCAVVLYGMSVFMEAFG